MKALIPFVLALGVSGLACAQSAAPARTPIKPLGDCMRIDQINEWHLIDDRTAIVRTGPKRFRVNLANDCPRLGLGPAGLIFAPNPANATLGNSRICGEVGETVRSSQQPPCAIRSVQIIDKAEFDRLAAKAKRHGSGADQPTARP